MMSSFRRTATESINSEGTNVVPRNVQMLLESGFDRLSRAGQPVADPGGMHIADSARNEDGKQELPLRSGLGTAKTKIKTHTSRQFGRRLSGRQETAKSVFRLRKFIEERDQFPFQLFFRGIADHQF